MEGGCDGGGSKVRDYTSYSLTKGGGRGLVR